MTLGRVVIKSEKISLLSLYAELGLGERVRNSAKRG